MFVGDSPFYFATIRKISVAFGSLFNNIYIQRFDQPGGQGNVERTIRVPLQYAAGEKWYVHRLQDTPAAEGVQTKVSLPRLAFELTGIQYDAQRQLNRTAGTACPGGANGNFLSQLNPVPYDLSFDLHLAVKNIDDALQIVEQIMPNFAPSQNLAINDIPELQVVKNVPIILQGVGINDAYEGAFEDYRVNVWTMSFVVKAYLYPGIKDAEVIRQVFANIYKDEEFTDKESVVSVRVDPIDALFTDNWQAKTAIFRETMLDSNGDPITDSNGDPIEDVFSLYDPDLALRLWLDSADRTTVDYSDGLVSRWRDKSLNRYEAVQSDDAKKFNYNTKDVNGNSVMDMTAAQSMTVDFGEDLPAAQTVIIVSAWDDNLTANAYMYDGIEASKRRAFFRNTNVATFYAGSNVTAGLQNTNLNINATIFDGANSTNYQNGSETALSANPGSVVMTGLTLGASYDDQEHADGHIAEVLVFDTVLNASQLNLVNKYLSEKWNISVIDVV